MLEGNVLITGGSGFLGRGIIAHARAQGWPCGFTVYSRNEHQQAECRRKLASVDSRVHYVLGDVRDTDRLALVMSGHDTVIHAAAMKSIPQAELNAAECVSVNVDGARSVIDASRAAGVRRVVGVSTDKAAQPVNIYGMTKAVMERLFTDASLMAPDSTQFTTCRYGNVIGSTGSVVPIMLEQAERDHRITLTDPNMTRFWMSIGQAVETVAYATTAIPGSVVIPFPRSATMRAVGAAVQEIAGEDAHHVDVIGRRPGEKMHEDLVSAYERLRVITVPQGYMVMLPPGNEDYANELPTISSDTAERVAHHELVRWIQDSVNV